MEFTVPGVAPNPSNGLGLQHKGGRAKESKRKQSQGQSHCATSSHLAVIRVMYVDPAAGQAPSAAAAILDSIAAPVAQETFKRFMFDVVGCTFSALERLARIPYKVVILSAHGELEALISSLTLHCLTRASIFLQGNIAARLMKQMGGHELQIVLLCDVASAARVNFRVIDYVLGRAFHDDVLRKLLKRLAEAAGHVEHLRAQKISSSSADPPTYKPPTLTNTLPPHLQGPFISPPSSIGTADISLGPTTLSALDKLHLGIQAPAPTLHSATRPLAMAMDGKWGAPQMSKGFPPDLAKPAGGVERSGEAVAL